MREGGDGPGLALESRNRLGDDVPGAGDDRVRQHFDRDVATEAWIVGAVDLSHSSGVEQRADFIGAQA